MLSWFVSLSHRDKRWAGTQRDCMSPLWLSHPPLILPSFGLGAGFPRKGSLGPYGEPLSLREAPSPQSLGPELSSLQGVRQMDRQSSLRKTASGWGAAWVSRGRQSLLSPAPQPHHPALSPVCFPLWLCWLQARYHLCAAGWLDGERVGYPTAFSSPNCGAGHVGIVDYGKRVNLSETWDVFCYREKGKRVLCCIPLRRDGTRFSVPLVSSRSPDNIARDSASF